MGAAQLVIGGDQRRRKINNDGRPLIGLGGQLGVDGSDLLVPAFGDLLDPAVEFGVPGSKIIPGGRRHLQLLHHLQLGVLKITDPAFQVLDLLHQTGQCLGVADRTVVDPPLVPDPALAYRFQVGLGLTLGELEIGDLGLGGHQIGSSGIALRVEPRQLGEFGKVGPTMPQLGDRRVDGLQIEQPELGRVVGFDESVLP